ncbi:MAG: LamG-like jellyroll fold domain-containing protein, partial [Anaerolineae bacterium]
YVDGELRATGERASSDLTGGQLRIGFADDVKGWFSDGDPSDPANYHEFNVEIQGFTGYIDGVEVYPRAVSAREAKQAYRSPLAVYALDEMSGATTFNDESHGGYGAATCSGSTCPKAGESGMAYRAVKFDGNSDVLTGPDLPLANESFSFAFWAKRDRTGSFDCVVTQGSRTTNEGLHLCFRDNDQFTFAFYGNDLNAPAFADTEWHQWAGTYDAEANVRILYRDGEAIAQDNPTSPYLGSGALSIGKGLSTDQRYFSGWLDELAFWPHALSAEEVEELYEKIKALDESVTECMVPRTTTSSTSLDFDRLALRETTTLLGRSTQEREDVVTVDATLPTAQITSLSNNQHLGVTGTLIIEGLARDNSYVTGVEVSVDGGAWEDAEGAETWLYEWDTSVLGEGSHTLSARATDPGGNVGNPHTLNLLIDRTPPSVIEVRVPQQAYLNSDMLWAVPLQVQLGDATAGRMEALLEGGPGVAGHGWQGATYRAADHTWWDLDYILPAFNNDDDALIDPSGTYTLSLRAKDDVDNQMEAAVYAVFALDHTGPVADLRYTGPSTTVISSTSIVLTGVITDPGSTASGVDELEVVFAPLEQRDAYRDAVLRLFLDERPDQQTFLDYSGYSNHGTCQPDHCPGASKMSLPGTYDYAKLFRNADQDVIHIQPDGNLRLISGTFTLAAWAEPWLDEIGDTFGVMGYQTGDGRYYPSMWLVRPSGGGQEFRAGFTDTDGNFNS